VTGVEDLVQRTEMVAQVGYSVAGRSRGIEAEDGWVNVTGYIGHFYSKIVVSSVLDHRGIVVF
jgi:hypothetical protein